MELKPSRCFVWSLLTLHLLSAIVVCMVMLPWAVKLLLVVMLVGSLIYFWRRDVTMKLSASWREIAFGQLGISAARLDGEIMAAISPRHTVILPWFAVVALRAEGVRIASVRMLCRDAMDEEEFHQLRLYLRFTE